MKTVITVLLGLVFPLFALLNAKLIFWQMRPPKHKPLVFFLGGSLFLLIGLVSAYLAYSGIELEVVHCMLKSCSVYKLADQAFAYWIAVVFWYVFGASFVGLGLAQIRLCFRGEGREP